MSETCDHGVHLRKPCEECRSGRKAGRPSISEKELRADLEDVWETTERNFWPVEPDDTLAATFNEVAHECLENRKRLASVRAELEATKAKIRPELDRVKAWRETNDENARLRSELAAIKKEWGALAERFTNQSADLELRTKERDEALGVIRKIYELPFNITGRARELCEIGLGLSSSTTG